MAAPRSRTTSATAAPGTPASAATPAKPVQSRLRPRHARRDVTASSSAPRRRVEGLETAAAGRRSACAARVGGRPRLRVRTAPGTSPTWRDSSRLPSHLLPLPLPVRPSRDSCLSPPAPRHVIYNPVRTVSLGGGHGAVLWGTGCLEVAAGTGVGSNRVAGPATGRSQKLSLSWLRSTMKEFRGHAKRIKTSKTHSK